MPEHNVTCVGEAAVENFRGLNVMMIASGYDDPLVPPTQKAIDFPFPPQVKRGLEEVRAFDEDFRGIDLLITGDRPLGVAQPDEDREKKAGNSALSSAAALLLRPRYHIASGTPHVYISLGPFVVPKADHATRFFALGSATASAKSTKQRWLYAAAMAPLTTLAADQLERDAAGFNPYRLNLAVPPDLSGYQAPQTQRVDRKRSGREHYRERIQRQRFDGNPVDAKCWFCLSNEKDLHLVVAVGNEVFVALAKGPLVPNHVLIAPIAHLRASIEGSEAFRAELETYKTALQSYFEKELDADTLFYERVISLRGGDLHSHTQIQVVPVPKAMTANAAGRLSHEAEGAKVKLVEKPKRFSLREYIENETDSANPEYFYARLPDGSEAVQLITNDRKARQGGDQERSVHPMQFGRRYAASLLQMMHRVDWKRCTGTIEEETRSADAIREGFAKYDPMGKATDERK